MALMAASVAKSLPPIRSIVSLPFWRARKLLDISPARLIRDDGVGGSNPLTPTNLLKDLAEKSKSETVGKRQPRRTEAGDMTSR
jgi:hypothetical protein